MTDKLPFKIEKTSKGTRFHIPAADIEKMSTEELDKVLIQLLGFVGCQRKPQ